MADPNARLPAVMAEVRAAGWKINNLFHRMDGQCQANLRTGDASPGFFEWGYGSTFVEALEKALDNAKVSKRVTRTQAGMVNEPVPVTEKVVDPELEWSTELEVAAAAGALEPEDPEDMLG